MKSMKKILALILSIAMLLGLTACGAPASSGADSGSPASTSSEAKEEPVVTEEPAPTEEPEPATEPEEPAKKAEDEQIPEAKLALPKISFKKGALDNLVYVLSTYLFLRLFIIWLTSGLSVKVTGVPFSAVYSVHDMMFNVDGLSAISIITIILICLSAVACLIPLFFPKINKLFLLFPAITAFWTFIWYIIELASSKVNAGPGFYGIIFILFCAAIIGGLTWAIVKAMTKK